MVDHSDIDVLTVEVFYLTAYLSLHVIGGGFPQLKRESVPHNRACALEIV